MFLLLAPLPLLSMALTYCVFYTADDFFSFLEDEQKSVACSVMENKQQRRMCI